jgi:hypothetical protein
MAVALMAWFASQPAWKRLTQARELELWRFASLRTAGGPALDTSRTAEVACAFCSHSGECDTRLKQASPAPVSQCPNRKQAAPGSRPGADISLIVGMQLSERMRLRAASDDA